MTITAETPGYDHRLEIWFSRTKRGQKIAQYFDRYAMRTRRVGLAAAELFITLGQADEVSGHPFPPLNINDYLSR